MIKKDELININIIPLGYKKNKKVVEIETKDNKYVLKEKETDINNIYNYLKERNYNYFPSYIETNKYYIYEYTNELNISDEEKAIEIINLVALLHTKTTKYKEIDIDDIKIIYEDIKNKLDDLKDYYENLNNEIEEELFMSPSNYLLIRNITKIYNNIEFSNNLLENWYESIKDKKKIRVSLIHNNLDLSHIRKKDKEYLISWDKAKFDIPIYDLYQFCENNNNIDFSYLLNIYNNKYPLLNEEISLLFLLISIPNKINDNKNEYEKTLNVNNILKKIYKTDRIISEYYSKNQEEENN